MNSRHYTKDRQNREAIITQIGVGTVIKEVVVDRGHRNGPEIHKITDTEKRKACYKTHRKTRTDPQILQGR